MELRLSCTNASIWFIFLLCLSCFVYNFLYWTKSWLHDMAQDFYLTYRFHAHSSMLCHVFPIVSWLWCCHFSTKPFSIALLFYHCWYLGLIWLKYQYCIYNQLFYGLHHNDCMMYFIFLNWFLYNLHNNHGNRWHAWVYTCPLTLVTWISKCLHHKILVLYTSIILSPCSHAHLKHVDMMTWKHFPPHWAFVMGNPMVDSPHKGSVMWSCDIFFASQVAIDLRGLKNHVASLWLIVA